MEEIGPEVQSGTGLRKTVCSLCHEYSSYRFIEVYHHIRQMHSFDPHFSVICGLRGCQATFKNTRNWRRHLTLMHERAPTTSTGQNTSGIPFTPAGPQDEEQIEIPEDINVMSSLSDTKRDAAMFIMKTRDSGYITQAFLDGLLENVSILQEKMISNLHQRMLQAMDQADQDPLSLRNAASAVVLDSRNHDLFRELHSEQRQNTYIRETFGLVEPRERVLGRAIIGSKVIDECCYDISLIQSLQAMLNCKVVQENVLDSHRHGGGVMVDFCDGVHYSSHPLFKNDPTALQIILYYDDVEVSNPLGSSATIHKLGLFYFTLGNLEPRLRSSTDSIQLVAVVKTEYFEKYSPNEILRPFVDDLKKLESDGGINFNIGLEKRRFRGSLVAFCGDNLASQDVGGFIRLASAYRRCRNCMATNEQLQHQFVSEEFTARTVQAHKTVCFLLESTSNQQHMETTYGVRRDSILNSLRYFHVITGFPPDVMHDVLEGALQVEICCLLRVLIKEKKLFSLDYLNERIMSFPWGADAKDHPPHPLPKTCIDEVMSTHLKLGASEAWALGRLLPILVGDLVAEDDSHWRNYLLMLDILDLVMATKTTLGHAMLLKRLIGDHHAAFSELYPYRPLTPKMHYMVHIPEWISRFGPVKTMWCMRYEAKHHYFKKIARTIGNFKNIAKSVAFRHQRHICYVLSEPDMFLKDRIELGRAENVVVADFEYKRELLACANSLSLRSVVQRAKWVVCRGVKYKTGETVALKPTENHPVFGVIVSVVVHPNYEPWLVVDELKTVHYVDHYHSYEVACPPIQSVIVTPVSKLADHSIVGNYQPFDCRRNFVFLKYHLLDSVDLSAPSVQESLP